MERAWIKGNKYKYLKAKNSIKFSFTDVFKVRYELIYSAALMDGILLGYWVALVGRGVEKIVV
jgi:hypothetical protein